MYLADRSPLSGQSKFGKNTVKRLKTDSNEVRRDRAPFTAIAILQKFQCFF